MADPNAPNEPGPTGPVRGANWGDPALRKPDLDESERRQRNALIGLAVASAIVLLIGSVAFLASRSGASGSSAGPITQPTSDPTSSSSSIVETTTTSTTSTTLPAPVEAIADAGEDLAVDAGDVVTLEAVAVTEGAEDDDVTWRQLDGPDVTAGMGALGGRAVSFGAPDEVVTLRFELVVTSDDRASTAPEAIDELVVRVFEQADRAVFVDAERGDDAADGSMAAPLRSLAEAARRATDGADVYARSAGRYIETETIRLAEGTSLYGGFDDSWDRDRGSRIRIDAAPIGLLVVGDGDRWISAVELTGAAADPGGRAIGVRIADGESITIEDSRIVSGQAGDGLGVDGDGLAGTSVGVLATDSGEVRLERSTVNGGQGGAGASPTPAQDRPNGANGEDADGDDSGAGGAAGDGGGDRRRGGDGGDGAADGSGDDAAGDAGGNGGEDDGDDGGPGRAGAAGEGGAGGNGGEDVVEAEVAVPVGASGDQGASGSSGLGAGGGGGGASGSGVDPATGGGGGGGGAGGRGSDGGVGGGGGGGSIGVWAIGVDAVVIDESLVAAGRGGDGAAGAAAGAGGRGGDGGDGVQGDGAAAGGGTDGSGTDGGGAEDDDGAEGDEAGGPAGDGGGGAGGGAGGRGGTGGGGAGGPSYGLLTTDVDAVVVTASTVRGGGGGNGADGGAGGAAGAAGTDGDGRSGGTGGVADAGDIADSGRGASGGSSFGWFDDGDAVQTFDAAEFVEGQAGFGGRGSAQGETGLEATANVAAEDE